MAECLPQPLWQSGSVLPFNLFWKKYTNLVCMIVMWSSKAIVAFRVLFFISKFCLKKYSTSFIVIDLSFSLASFEVYSVFGTKPCFIEIYVSFDFLLTHININKIIILTN